MTEARTFTEENPVRVFLLDDHEVVPRSLAALLDAEPAISVVGDADTAAHARTGSRSTLDECRERCAADLRGLPPTARQIRDGAPRATASERFGALTAHVRRRIEEQMPAAGTQLLGPEKNRTRVTSVRTEMRRKAMRHTVEWKVRLHLFEDDEGTTKARVVLDPGTTALTGQGVARCHPADTNVPEIGDEMAAGRAMNDLAQQLLNAAERDIEGVGASRSRAREVTGWPCNPGRAKR